MSAGSSTRSPRAASPTRTRVLYSSDHGDNLGTRGLWGKSTMYEESAGVPMILAGPGVPQGVVCHEPVSLVDASRRSSIASGAPAHPDDRDLPGASLFDVVRGAGPRRTMHQRIPRAGRGDRRLHDPEGPFKYVYYAGMPPQLFDLDADPQEARDLGAEAGYRGARRRMRGGTAPRRRSRRRRRQAKADQAARIAALGGREAILARGSFVYSPAPGTKPVYAGTENPAKT